MYKYLSWITSNSVSYCVFLLQIGDLLFCQSSRLGDGGDGYTESL